MMGLKSKILLFSIVCAVALGTIGYLFYQEELKFMQPTRVPENFKDVKTGTQIDLNKYIDLHHENPSFLHFYNPFCQCSKFNADHFSELVEEFHGRVNFYVIIQGKDPEMISDFQKKYDLNVIALLDKDGSISKKCGIYSTPQAVILDKEQKIYYKGNYNKARFCDSKKTAFAETALEYLLADKKLPMFSQVATVPYGCELPSNENDKNKN